ncbi:Helicase conserved C-terminal domain-containing protein [Streptomyces sp. DvalAA-14]|uniref:helicase-related protein n=1 Tax=unclassified Streptomyces TaxID=2593676 RepID=UPI00081B3FCB|nr:helicase-related protein [Streptomyces sp. DvalAA-14]MYS22801.1 DNA helicase [Streptomyces sp. SID4948]SCE22609.1 Helicase conserved C-terminal domain-containing protein [Streptomyces sp. DvalAA-14]
MSVSEHKAHYDVRDSLLDAVRKDLLGPAGEVDEVLKDDAPITMYAVGVLFPRPRPTDTPDGPAELEAERDGVDETPTAVRINSEEPAADLGVSLANVRMPSSIGLTFAVAPEIAPRIRFSIEAAVYTPEDPDGNPVSAKRTEARSTKSQQEYWRRIALRTDPLVVDITTARVLEPFPLFPRHPGLELRVLVRPASGPDGTVTVTATVVNSLEVGPYDLRDAHCFYQPVLTVTAEDGETAAFVERPAASGAVDPEQALSRMLHRHAPSFATGHGCAAHWKWTPPSVDATDTRRAAVSAVRTDFVPSHEVLLTDSNPEIDDSALTMHGLGTAPTADIVGALRALLTGYETWIRDRTAQSRLLAGTEHEAVAAEQIERCLRALRRMHTGVDLLADEKRPEILRAFRLANLAMADQRARTSWIRKGKSGLPETAEGKWRPFQVSFMLLCLAGIVDAEHEDRNVADLLWFPTGGGKTEAYLGLIAFTTFLRRLRGGGTGGGVTVLMRYTLRLLTLQQFERAAVLICAMEILRAGDPSALGHEEISIGMWVGRSATPNKLAVAAEKLRELRSNPLKPIQTENPVQLRACPWCGEPLSPNDYAVDTADVRMTISCPGAGCDFNAGLPVHLVDEAVYRAHPTLVIATVDKFASMPWRPESAALFNRDRVDGTRPPELVVQDELHLISGPLGTLTGLYETAVDALARRPKIIASTATIRRADEQGSRLFARKVEQFPPAGLDSRDSWFAVETPKERKATRRYLGLLTSSTSQSTLLIRVYAALLHRASTYDAPPEIKDAYWTLVGYFNSLRLLSAAELQVLDDVQDRLDYLAVRDGVKGRRIDGLTELSSRANASDISRRLKELERQLPMSDVLDVLLATNMISVGVDVDRLGLMAVMGQPQTTAEYIQATSRVGRRHPGLVAVMLNSTRSRDRSHYEDFHHFHSALYREVESTSVTPFSARARDRGLHAVIVALTRLMLPAARSNQAAARIEDFLPDLNKTVRSALLDRVARVESSELGPTTRDFDDFVEWWRVEAETHPKLVYEAARGTRAAALLSGFAEEAENAPPGLPTLWSLRDVDASSTFFEER